MLMVIIVVASASAQRIEYLSAEPLENAVTATKGAVHGGQISLPLITWGGDVATIHTNNEGVFKQEGVDVRLFVENNFVEQVNGCLSGTTPYLRGTLGMINAAAPVFKKYGIELVTVYQLTYSTGGDALVVRPGINKPADLAGKTIALQLYGPHMDYIMNVLSNAGVPVSKVTFKWLKELTLPTYDTKGKTIDPVSAFREDKDIDAVLCISPDAFALTSGGTVGTGGEGSVKGAKILLSTKTAKRIIADVYAVRSDYFESNRTSVFKLTHALMRGQESYENLLQKKSSQQAKYQQLLSKSAELLMGSSTATGDVEGMIGDCEYVGFSGNVAFFTGKGTNRTLKTLNGEIQGSFVKLGILSGKVSVPDAEWNWSDLASGLSNAKNIPESKPVFDAEKVEKTITRKIAAEPTKWDQEGSLFVKEINFGPNQSDFTEAEYAEDFSTALNLSETYSGALVTIEGHSDPLGVLKAKEKGEDPKVIDQMRQSAKNLSLDRAKSVMKSFLAYAKKRGVTLDVSKFVPVGIGITSPKYNPPTTKAQWEANRRVVFRIKNIEAEADEFTPLGGN